MDLQKLAQALRDTAQSASNSAAGNLSAPVDALAWALRKTGLPIPENAVGGSDWMNQKGLTVPVNDGMPKMLGEVLGGMAPILATSKAPQIASGVNRMIDNAMAPATIGKQRGVINFPQSWSRSQKSESVKNIADDLANKFNEKGFQASVEHSGSAVGPSSYVRVFDPQTGRYVVDPFRISDHSKGPIQSQFVNEIPGSFDAPDFSMALETVAKMREKGPTEFMKMQIQKEQERLARKVARNQSTKVSK